MPDEAFFHQNPKLLGLGRQFGQINVWAFRVFRPIYQHPLAMFSINQPLFLQNLSLYIQIPNIYLGLGFDFEFGLQRIRDFAIVCPLYVGASFKCIDSTE